MTVNELTLGVERFVRAGNREGANKLTAKLAELLGEPSLGKVAPAPKAAPRKE